MVEKIFFKKIILLSLLLLTTTSSSAFSNDYQTLHFTSSTRSSYPTFGIRVSPSDYNFENNSPANSSCQEPLDKFSELQLLLLTPTHILEEYSISLEKYLCSKDPQKLFEQHNFYSNTTYLNHIRNRTGYERFILELHKKIHGNHKFRKSLRRMVGFDEKNGFADFIGREVDRIKQEQVARALREKEKRDHREKTKQEKQEQELQKQLSPKTIDPESLSNSKKQKLHKLVIPQETKKPENNEQDECKREELEKEVLEQVKWCQQELEKKNLKNLEFLSWDWTDAADEARDIGDKKLAQRYEDRLKALGQTVAQPDRVVDFSNEFKLNQEFYEYFPHAELFEICQGTELDKQLHKELLDTITTTIDLTKQQPNNFFIQTNIPIIHHFTAFAKTQENFETAFNLSDFCYHMTQMVTGYAKLAGGAVEVVGREVAKGAVLVGKGAAVMGRGVAQGATNCVLHSAIFLKNIATSPITTIQIDIINPLCIAAISLGKVLHLAFQDFEQFKDNADRMIQKTQSLIRLYPERAIAYVTELLLPFGTRKLAIGTKALNALKNIQPLTTMLREQKAIATIIEATKKASVETQKLSQPVKQILKKAGEEVGREIVLSKVKTYGQAMNEALKWLEPKGFKAEKIVFGKFGKIKGKPIGMKTADGKIGFRVEYDTRSGAHLNIWAGKEKGPHLLFDEVEKSITKLQSLFGK